MKGRERERESEREGKEAGRGKGRASKEQGGRNIERKRASAKRRASKMEKRKTDVGQQIE